MIVEPARPPPVGAFAARTGDATTAATNAATRNPASFFRISPRLSRLARRGNFSCKRSELGRRAAAPASLSRALLCHVAKLDRVAECAELLQALVLDLADPLARDVECPADLVQRARMLAVEAVAQLEHLALAARERAEDLPQRFLAQRDLGLLVGERQVLVG